MPESILKPLVDELMEKWGINFPTNVTKDGARSVVADAYLHWAYKQLLEQYQAYCREHDPLNPKFLLLEEVDIEPELRELAQQWVDENRDLIEEKVQHVHSELKDANGCTWSTRTTLMPLAFMKDY